MKADFIVQAPSRTYPVFVRDGKPGEELRKYVTSLDGGTPFLVLDQQVEKHYGVQLRSLLFEEGGTDRTFVVPSGESSKSVEQWAAVTDFFLENGVRRNTPVLVAGGGVTGDLAGFAAATTMRGLPLIHIPTTLLAMVDSSIGGKTGINHSAGKNLIGSFYQPRAIFIHTGFLATLPRNEWINGLSEILKYGAIRHPAIFRTCRELFIDQEVTHEDPKLVELIRTCAKIKADVVAADEHESQLRMILNFGHTFAHALEKLGDYRVLSHGEAVFLGMLAGVDLSNRLSSSLSPDTIRQFRPLYDLDPAVAEWDVEELIRAMYHDKKRSTNYLKMVLLQEWGTPYVTETENTEPVREAWRFAMGQISLTGSPDH